eukprot:scaffold910_cov396-Prasinococcus_capsulatus_cf.AAC.40
MDGCASPGACSENGRSRAPSEWQAAERRRRRRTWRQGTSIALTGWAGGAPCASPELTPLRRWATDGPGNDLGHRKKAHGACGTGTCQPG